MFESIFTGRDLNRKWFEGVVLEKAFQKEGWIYTINEKDEFVECLEAVYKRDRLKQMLFDTLKKSIMSIKKSETSDSVHTLTEEIPKLYSEISEPKIDEPQISFQNEKLAHEFDQVVEDHDNFLQKSKKSNIFYARWILLFSVIAAGTAIYYY